MRTFAFWLTLALAIAFALPGLAQDDETASEATAPVVDEPLVPADPHAEGGDPVTESSSEGPAPLIDEPLVPPDPFAEEYAEEEEEEEENEALAEYRAAVGNRYLIGLNSLITFPADPVMSAVSPDEEWNELPLGVATKYPVGFFQGSLLMAYRLTAGTFDLLMAPVTPMRMISPAPRYLLFEDAEHEDYY
jgi:hypothetical protein